MRQYSSVPRAQWIKIAHIRSIWDNLITMHTQDLRENIRRKWSRILYRSTYYPMVVDSDMLCTSSSDYSVTKQHVWKPSECTYTTHRLSMVMQRGNTFKNIKFSWTMPTTPENHRICHANPLFSRKATIITTLSLVQKVNSYHLSCNLTCLKIKPVHLTSNALTAIICFAIIDIYHYATRKVGQWNRPPRSWKSL